MKADSAVPRQPADQRHRFPHPGQWLGVGHPVLAFDLYLVTGPDAQNKTATRQIVDGQGRHRDRRGGADEDAGDARTQKNARGLRRAGGKHGELIPAMPFGYPCRTRNPGFRRASHSRRSGTGWRPPKMLCRSFANQPLRRHLPDPRRFRAQDRAFARAGQCQIARTPAWRCTRCGSDRSAPTTLARSMARWRQGLCRRQSNAEPAAGAALLSDRTGRGIPRCAENRRPAWQTRRLRLRPRQ